MTSNLSEGSCYFKPNIRDFKPLWRQEALSKNLHIRVIFRDILSLNMKVSSILVISVIIKLHKRVILKDTKKQDTVNFSRGYGIISLKTHHNILIFFSK